MEGCKKRSRNVMEGCKKDQEMLWKVIRKNIRKIIK